MNDLATRIEQRLRLLPARDHQVVTGAPVTLGAILDRGLIRRIAEEAANEAATERGQRASKDREIMLRAYQAGFAAGYGAAVTGSQPSGAEVADALERAAALNDQSTLPANEQAR